MEKAIPYFIRMSDGNVIQLEYHDSLPSVTELTREYARQGYPDRYVVLAEELKSSKDESKKRGIYMSLILRPSIFPSQAVFISPAAAVAASIALSEHTTKSLGVGWISDIFCDSRLIGSITVEGKLDDFTSYEYLIITFSLQLDGENFPPRLTDMIRKVFESENTSIAMIIAKNVLEKFFLFYTNIKSPQKLMNTYKNLFVLRGEHVRCNIDGFTKSYKVLGVDASSCALIVEARSGKIEIITNPRGVVIPKRLKKK